MALDKKTVVAKMKERGFVVYATVNSTKIHFVSAHMYDSHYEEKVQPRDRVPVFNVIVNLDNGEFECLYNIAGSINMMCVPACSPVMDDDHFDHIVSKFEAQIKWMARLC